MKNNLILAFVCALFLSCSIESDKVNEQENLQTNSSVSNVQAKLFGGGGISFGIGRNSRNCGGFGICKINSVSVIIEDHTITWTNQNKTVNCSYGTVDKDNFYFYFNENIIDELVQIQGGYNLKLEENFVFEDSRITDKMKIESNFQITEGSYPIVYDNEIKMYKVLITNSK